MRHLVCDIETDGLLDVVTRLHCLVLRDMESDSVISCTNSAPGHPTIEEGLSLLSEAEKVYGHNFIKYDLKVIQKLYPGFTLKGKVLDTYVTSAMRWAHIKDSDWSRASKGSLPKKLIGKQTLEAWGYRLGVTKVGVEIDDWSQWTPLMQARCESDTAVTKTLVQRIRSAGIAPQSIETEHELAYYLFQQEHNGWPFDVKAAVKLQASLAGKRQALDIELRKMIQPWQVSRGMFTPKRDDTKRGYVKGVTIERFKMVEFNPSSRPHIANRMKALYGWKPEVFTDAGAPKVDANTLKGLDYPPVAKIREYLILDDTLGSLAEGKQALLKNFTDQGPEGGKLTGLPHIHGGVVQTGTITHRASHIKPPLTQVPKVGKPWGSECRSLLRVPKGWVQIGADASGLELRCLAHYMAKYDDGAYAKVLLEGDVHSITQQALSAWLSEGKLGRDTAKTWKYAFLYGAGDEKLGKILAPGKKPKEQEAIGAKSRSMFFKKLPALKYVIQAVEKEASQKGYLVSIDGRRVYVRSQHAVLNTLLQTAGSIVCRRWMVVYNRALMDLFDTPPGGGWLYPWAALGWFHDENQLATWDDPLVIEATKTVLVDSIRSMTSHFNFRCPLDGEAKVGRNWMETH